MITMGIIIFPVLLTFAIIRPRDHKINCSTRVLSRFLTHFVMIVSLRSCDYYYHRHSNGGSGSERQRGSGGIAGEKVKGNPVERIIIPEQKQQETDIY